MATRRERAEQALENPNVQVMLDLIAEMEGVEQGYRTGFGNDVLPSLEDHPRYLRLFTETGGRRRQTSAAGRYQFTQGTWDEEKERLGLEDFGPRSQDLAAVSRLIMRGALDDVLQGDFRGAVNKIGNEWVSAPSSNEKQPKRNWDFVANYLEPRGINLNSNQPQSAVLLPQDVANRTAATADAVPRASGSSAGEGGPRASGSSAGERRSNVTSADGTQPVAGFNPIEAVNQVFDQYAIANNVQAPAPAESAVETLANEQTRARLDRPIASDDELLVSQNEDLLRNAAQSDAGAARTNAVRAFFGEPSVPNIQLPDRIETLINRYLARL